MGVNRLTTDAWLEDSGQLLADVPHIGFEAFMTVEKWIVVFSVVTLCSFIGGYQCYREMYSLHLLP
jgi:hypothetical protein